MIAGITDEMFDKARASTLIINCINRLKPVTVTVVFVLDENIRS